jgi:hypothetical protein
MMGVVRLARGARLSRRRRPYDPRQGPCLNAPEIAALCRPRRVTRRLPAPQPSVPLVLGDEYLAAVTKLYGLDPNAAIEEV